MARRNKLSRDQKRKRKLAQRARARGTDIEPYRGRKYQNEKYVDAHLATETAIYEVYVITDREITDHHVRASLGYLIHQLRGENPPLPEDGPQTDDEHGQPQDLIAYTIKQHWEDLFTEQPRHATQELVGVLRSILGSVETWSRPAPGGRGYLRYLEGFLNELGVRVEVLPDAQPDTQQAEAVSADEQGLTALGEAWLGTRDADSMRAFHAKAEALAESGQAGTVIEVCQHLIGRSNEPVVVAQLQDILKIAWKHEPPQPRRRGLKDWLRRIRPR
jgi:hypothetical protein